MLQVRCWSSSCAAVIVLVVPRAWGRARALQATLCEAQWAPVHDDSADRWYCPRCAKELLL